MNEEKVFFKNKIKFVFNEKIKNPIVFYNVKEKKFSQIFEKLPKEIQKKLETIIKKEKISNFQVKIFHTFNDDFQNIILIGFENFNLRNFHYFSRIPIRVSIKERIERIDMFLPDLYAFSDVDFFDFVKYFVVNAVMSSYDFSQFYKNEDIPSLKEINIITKENIEKPVKEGIVMGEIINTVRNLSNMPGGEMTPDFFIKVIKKIKIPKLKIKILDRKKLERLKMNSILAVGKGSVYGSYLAILEYYGTNKKEKPYVLIGKGITFDTGGLHLKPAEGMKDMNLDMSGGAGVLGALMVCAKLKIKKNVIGFIPIAENMPGNDSYRPGDLIKSLSGKIIEVVSPDAEGRVILADAIHYSKKYNPKVIITLATLTGASMIALGNKASALLSNLGEEKIDEIKKLSYLTGDFVWDLPLWEEYLNDIKSQFGDLANVGKSRYGGVMHGAIFLYEFAKPYDFIHIDMAPKMVSNDEDNLAPGSFGFGVKILTEIIKKDLLKI